MKGRNPMRKLLESILELLERKLLKRKALMCLAMAKRSLYMTEMRQLDPGISDRTVADSHLGLVSSQSIMEKITSK